MASARLIIVDSRTRRDETRPLFRGSTASDTRRRPLERGESRIGRVIDGFCSNEKKRMRKGEKANQYWRGDATVNRVTRNSWLDCRAFYPAIPETDNDRYSLVSRLAAHRRDAPLVLASMPPPLPLPLPLPLPSRSQRTGSLSGLKCRASSALSNLTRAVMFPTNKRRAMSIQRFKKGTKGRWERNRIVLSSFFVQK